MSLTDSRENDTFFVWGKELVESLCMVLYDLSNIMWHEKSVDLQNWHQKMEAPAFL